MSQPKSLFFSILMLAGCLTQAVAQKLTVTSPNQKISVALFNPQNAASGEWYLKLSYADSGKTTEAIPKIALGLLLKDQDFSKELLFLRAGKPAVINEKYTALHGKKTECSNTANEVVVSLKTRPKASSMSLSVLITMAWHSATNFLRRGTAWL